MSKNHYIYLISSLISASALGATTTFKDLDQSLLKNYFNQNSLSGLSCSLPDEKILAAYQHPSFSQSYADCFVKDASVYIIKISSSCPAETINGKLKAAANTFCPAPAAAASGGSGSGGSSSSSPTAAQTAAAIIPVIGAADGVDKAFKGAKKAPEPAQGSISTSAPSSAATSNTPVQNSAAPGSNTATTAPSTSTSSAAASSAPAEAKVTAFDDGSSIKTIDFADKSKQTITTNSDGVVTHVQVTDANGNTIYQGRDSAAAVADGKVAQENLRQSSPETANAGDAALSTAPVVADEAANLASKTDAASIQSFAAKSNTIISSANSAPGPCSPFFVKVGAAVQKYIVEKTACSKDVVMTDQICSPIRSPQAMAIQSLMTVGASAISQMSSASGTCSATSDLSKIGQAGATIWNLGCSAVKFKCDFNCGAASKALVAIDAAANESSLCVKELLAESNVLAAAVAAHTAAVGNASIQILALSSAQKPPVAASVASCEKHAVSIAQIATQVMGLAAAAQQAKDCKEKLSAGSGAGGAAGGAPTITTTQLCSDPCGGGVPWCNC
jgi:hypothetical protein